MTYLPRRGTGIVTDPHQWLSTAGYEFWFIPSADLVAASSATNISGLDSYGWTTTSLSVVAGTGNTFAANELDAVRLDFGASADTLASPGIFGSYQHMLQASKFLGYFPTKLTLEYHGNFYVASANETTSFFGFAVVGTTDITGAGGVAGIVSDGTNFRLRSDNGNDVGALVASFPEAPVPIYTIQVDATNTEWFINGSSQGTITTEDNVWPCSVVVRTGTTNRINNHWLRVFYS